jgi:tetratricopeptide (TPR) repeat protein
MKPKMKIFRTICMAVLLFGIMPSSAQVSEQLYPDFVRDEATYTSQPIVIERSSFDRPVTLRNQLNTLLGEMEYTRAYVVQSYKGGMESFVYETVDELLDKDPIFLSYDKGDGRLNRKQDEVNTSIYLHYKDANDKECCLVMHHRSRGMLTSTVYTRTSIMMPSENPKDDYRSFLSQSAPVTTSYLTVFDVKDMTTERLQFDSIYAKSVQKYNNSEELTPIEKECIEGILEERGFEYNLVNGHSQYEEGRLYDSYATLHPVFELLKKILPKDKPGADKLFYEISHLMGMSLWKLGFYDSAEYYLELAASGNESYKPDFADFVKSAQDRIPEVCSEITSRISVGHVLSTLFDVNENNLREAVYRAANRDAKLSVSADVWNFDLKKLCTPEPANLTIAYSYIHTVDTIDKSILFGENNIIMSSVKVDDKRWRINVMVPNFRGFDYKRPEDRFNTPLSASFIIGSEGMKPIKIKKNKKFYASLNKALDKVNALETDMRVMESLMLLKQMNQAISVAPESERSQEEISELHAYVLYRMGYYLTELNQSQKALSYLTRSLDIVPTYETMREYISNLSNIVDPRCLATIKAELDLSPEDQSYVNFLNRRYAYALIEYGKLDEAEVILKRLLESPENEKFARQELDYIESLRKEE